MSLATILQAGKANMYNEFAAISEQDAAISRVTKWLNKEKEE